MEYAYENKYPSELEGIREGLLVQTKNKHADSVLDCLWDILEGDYFRTDSTSIIEEGKLNVLSLRGISSSMQKVLVDIILSVIWRERREAGVENAKPLTVTLDEFQTMNLFSGSVLGEILTESRKYGLTLILATQTLEIYSKKQLALLNQSAVKIFFHPVPSEIASIAKLIDMNRVRYWEDVLNKLKVGQAVVVGELESNETGKTINRAILTKSEYGIDNT